MLLTKPSFSRVSFLMGSSHRISFHPSTPFWEHLPHFIIHLPDSLWSFLGNFSFLLNSWIHRRPAGVPPSHQIILSPQCQSCRQTRVLLLRWMCDVWLKREKNKGKRIILSIFFLCLSFSFLYDIAKKQDRLALIFFSCFPLLTIS